MSNVTEDWGTSFPRRTSRWEVKVSGPDAYVEIPRPHAAPGHQVKVYPICKVTVTWEWSDPNADDALVNFVTLYTADGDGRPDGGKLFLDQLREVPGWLSDIITRSMPRL
jgi:hypothetical protein